MSTPIEFARRPGLPRMPYSLPVPNIPKPPVYNPYDKFTQPEFDAWIGGITCTLRRALGHEDEATGQSASSSLQDEGSSSGDEEEVSRLIEANGESADEDVEDSFMEYQARRVGKGKARDPRDGPGFGKGDESEPILIDSDSDDGDEEEEQVIARSDEAEQSEEGPEEWDVEQSEDEEDEEDGWDRGESSSQAQIRRVQYQGEEEGEESDELDAEQSDHESDDYDYGPQSPAPASSPSPILVLSSDEEQDETADVGPPDHELDEDDSNEEYSDEEHTAPISRPLVEEVQPPRHRLKHQLQTSSPVSHIDDRSVVQIEDEVDEIQPSDDDTSFPPHDVFPNARDLNTPVKIRDPWSGPQTYAEDYYSSGDIKPPLENLTADYLGSGDDSDMSPKSTAQNQEKGVIEIGVDATDEQEAEDIQLPSPDTSFPPQVTVTDRTAAYSVEAPDHWSGPQIHTEGYNSSGDLQPLQDGILDADNPEVSDEGSTLKALTPRIPERCNGLEAPIKAVDHDEQPTVEDTPIPSVEVSSFSPQVNYPVELPDPWDRPMSYPEDYYAGGGADVEFALERRMITDPLGPGGDPEAPIIIDLDDEDDDQPVKTKNDDKLPVCTVETEERPEDFEEIPSESITSQTNFMGEGELDVQTNLSPPRSQVTPVVEIKELDFGGLYDNIATGDFEDTGYNSNNLFLETDKNLQGDITNINWDFSPTLPQCLEPPTMDVGYSTTFGAPTSKMASVEQPQTILEQAEPQSLHGGSSPLTVVPSTALEASVSEIIIAEQGELQEITGQPRSQPLLDGWESLHEERSTRLEMSTVEHSAAERSGPQTSLNGAVPSTVDQLTPSEANAEEVIVIEQPEPQHSVIDTAKHSSEADTVHDTVLAKDGISPPVIFSHTTEKTGASATNIIEQVLAPEISSEHVLLSRPETPPMPSSSLHHVLSSLSPLSDCSDLESRSRPIRVEVLKKYQEEDGESGKVVPPPQAVAAKELRYEEEEESSDAEGEFDPDHAAHSYALNNGKGSLAGKNGSSAQQGIWPVPPPSTNGFQSHTSYDLTVVLRKPGKPGLFADPYPASLSTPETFGYPVKFGTEEFSEGNTSQDTQDNSMSPHSTNSKGREDKVEDAILDDLKDSSEAESVDNLELRYPSVQPADLASAAPDPKASDPSDDFEADADGDLDPDFVEHAEKVSQPTHPVPLQPSNEDAVDVISIPSPPNITQSTKIDQVNSHHASNSSSPTLTRATDTSVTHVITDSPHSEDNLPSILIIKKPAALQNKRKDVEDGHDEPSDLEDPVHSPSKSKTSRPSKRRRSPSVARTSPQTRSVSSKQVDKHKLPPRSLGKPTGSDVAKAVNKSSIRDKGKGKEVYPPLTSKGSFDTRSVSSRSSSDASSALRKLEPSSQNNSRASSIASNAPSDTSSMTVQPSPTLNKSSSFHHHVAPPPPPLFHKHSHALPHHHHQRPAPVRQPTSQNIPARPVESPSTAVASNKSNTSHRTPSFSSPVTRSNCRYHKISVPLDENAPRVFFLVPGCSLGDRELIEEEEIIDHGNALPEDGRRMTPDLGAYAFEPYLLGVLRLLVGIEMLREQEIYYLPQPGPGLVPLRQKRSDDKPSTKASRDPGSSTDQNAHEGVSRRNSNVSATSPPASGSSSRSIKHIDMKPTSFASYTESELTEDEDSPKVKRPKTSPVDGKASLGDMGPPDLEPRSRISGNRRSMRLGRDALEYKPGEAEEEDGSSEDEQRARHSKAHKQGLKRSRTSDIAREPDIDAQKLKRQKTGNLATS